MFAETRYALNGDLHVAYRTSREGPRDLVFVSNWITNCGVFPELPSIQGWVEAMTSVASRTLCRGSGQLSRRLCVVRARSYSTVDVQVLTSDSTASFQAGLKGVSQFAERFIFAKQRHIGRKPPESLVAGRVPRAQQQGTTP